MKEVSKNIFWLTISRAISLVFLFLAYTRLLSYLGPFGAGQYQFVLSYVMIFSTVVDFGVLQFITKKMSEDDANTKKYFQNFLVFEAVVAFFLYGLLLSVAYFKHYDTVVFNAVLVTGLGMVVNALCYPFLAVMTAKQDIKKVALINFVNSLVNIGIIFLAVWQKKYIVFLASVQFVFGLIDLILYRVFIVKHLPKPEIFKSFSNFNFTVILNIFKLAWPFALLVGFSAIYNRIDVIIITKFLGFAQTGLYTAAYKFFDLLNFFPASVSHVLFPIFAALMAKNLITDVKLTLEKYIKLMTALALPIGVGGMVLSKQLIMLMTKNDFRFLPSADVLSILIWAVVILFIYIPLNSLVISQLTKKAMVITGANVLINIIGNIIFIPILGIKAAAIMTVVSEALQGIFYFYFVQKYVTNFKFCSIFWKPALGSLVMGIVIWQVRDLNLLLSAAIGIATYTSVLVFLRFIKKEDFIFVKKLLIPTHV